MTKSLPKNLRLYHFQCAKCKNEISVGGDGDIELSVQIQELAEQAQLTHHKVQPGCNGQLHYTIKKEKKDSIF